MVEIPQNIVKSKIKNICFTPIEQVLQADDVKQYISSLHSKFVICPIDKAGRNFAVVKIFTLTYSKRNWVCIILLWVMRFINL